MSAGVSRLLALPPELRRQIWKEVIGNALLFQGTCPDKMPILPQELCKMKFRIFEFGLDDASLRSEHDPNKCKWMLASPQIYAEATEMLWKETILCFDDEASFRGLMCFLKRGRWHENVSSIQINFASSRITNESQRLSSWDFSGPLPDLPALSHIRMCFDLNDAFSNLTIGLKWTLARSWPGVWNNSMLCFQQYGVESVYVFFIGNADNLHSYYRISEGEKIAHAKGIENFLRDRGNERWVQEKMKERLRIASGRGESAELPAIRY